MSEQSKEFSAPNDGEERDDTEESILRVATQAKQDVLSVSATVKRRGNYSTG